MIDNYLVFSIKLSIYFSNCQMPTTNGQLLKQTPSHRQSRHHDRYHAHQLDKDIQTRAGSVFERIANRIADNGCLMRLATLAAVVSFLDEFLCLIHRSIVRQRLSHQI